MEGWRVGEYGVGAPGFCLWKVCGGHQGGLPGAGGIGWLFPGKLDASSIMQDLQYPSLQFYSLHQVDPGVVLGKLEHLPGPTYNHNPTD